MRAYMTLGKAQGNAAAVVGGYTGRFACYDHTYHVESEYFSHPARMTMTSRTTTLRTTATMARRTGEDNNTSKDNGNNSKDDNNDGGNDNSGGGGGGGGKIGGEVGGVATSVAWLVAVFFAVSCLALTHRRKCTDTFGNKFILV